MLHDLYDRYLSSTGVCTDTRKLQEGVLFFALKGESFNGNLFAKDALDHGASLAIVDEEQYVKSDDYLLVDDVLATLQALARCHRRALGIPIVAITGSNGITTTKELMQAVACGQQKHDPAIDQDGAGVDIHGTTLTRGCGPWQASGAGFVQ